MPLFGIDAASFQGVVVWDLVDGLCAFGWEKVSEGAGYVNPFWPGAKTAMARRAKRTGFIPGGYMFLRSDADPAGQAEVFAHAAGDMTGFGIAIDVEPSGSSAPDLGQARAAVAALRALYPGHPVTGYIPRWYWGQRPTTFVDVLWASNYVTARPGPPDVMYRHVTAGQWEGYGGQVPALLQFTSRAAVPGVGGAVDCSAFLAGDQRAYRRLVAGAGPSPGPVTPPPVPAQPSQEDNLISGYVPAGPGPHPLALPNDAGRIRFFAARAAQLRIDWVGPGTASQDVPPLGYDHGAKGLDVPEGTIAAVIHRVTGPAGAGDGDEAISYVVMPRASV